MLGLSFLRREKTVSKDIPSSTFDSETMQALDEAVSRSASSKKIKKPIQDGSDQPTRPDIPQQIAGEIQKLFEPEQWEPICEMPFNLWVALSGRPEAQATEKEIKKLSVTTSMTAQYFLAVDPKWVAAVLFCMNWGAVLALKAASVKVAMLKELEEKKRMMGGG